MVDGGGGDDTEYAAPPTTPDEGERIDEGVTGEDNEVGL